MFEEKIDANPLLSRCLRIELAQRGLAEPFAARAHEIAVKEGLNGADSKRFLERVKQNRNNLRAVLQEVESGAFCAA